LNFISKIDWLFLVFFCFCKNWWGWVWGCKRFLNLWQQQMKCFYIGVIYKGTFTGSQGKGNGGVSKKKEMEEKGKARIGNPSRRNHPPSSI
jgi:hypothetical protein